MSSNITTLTINQDGSANIKTNCGVNLDVTARIPLNIENLQVLLPEQDLEKRLLLVAGTMVAYSADLYDQVQNLEARVNIMADFIKNLGALVGKPHIEPTQAPKIVMAELTP